MLFLGLIFYFSPVFLGVHGRNEIVFEAGVTDNKKIITISENSSYILIVRNIPFSASAVLFEAHSHVKNITLSYFEETCVHCFVTGKNTGIIYKLHSSESEAYMWLLHKGQDNIPCLIIVSVLDSYGPVPGGCNMEFATEIAPYLRLRNEFGSLYLEYQHASIGIFRDEPITSCSLSLSYITYEIYVLYMEENNFKEDEYFAKITIMSNLSLIKEQSNKVIPQYIHPDTRFSFLKYPNVGVIYNIVAKYTLNGKVKETRYVPVSTYGCGTSEFTEYGCSFSYIMEEKAFLFLLSMYGFLTCYFGHMFYGSSIFFFGFLTAFFVTLVLLCRYSNFSRSKILLLCGVLGVMAGTICLIAWLWFQNFLISLLLIGFVFGFLLTATVLYSPVGNLEIFLNDKNYWLLLATGSLLTTVLFIGYPTVLSILGSSVVGSYVMLLYYDDFIGARLSYIILNVVKRGISKQTVFALNEYPFQARDITICAAWFILSFSAIIFQSRSILNTSIVSFCFNKCCFCKFKGPNQSIPQLAYNIENNPHQRLLNDDSVFYNTFPK